MEDAAVILQLAACLTSTLLGNAIDYQLPRPYVPSSSRTTFHSLYQSAEPHATNGFLNIIPISVVTILLINYAVNHFGN